MKITWITYKRVDKELDRATWIEMTKELLKMGHFINLVVPHTGKRMDFGLGQNMIYLPALPWRIACTFTFSISLFFYLLLNIFLHTPRIVLMDSFAFFPSLPFLILSKIGWIRTKFVLDVRTLPVETYTLRGWIKEKLHIMALHGAGFLVDSVTVISPFMKKYIVNKYNIGRDKIGIWSSGVSLTLFNPTNVKSVGAIYVEARPKSRYFGKSPLVQDKFVVMYHGAFSSNRGLQSAIKAVGFLKAKYPNILLILVGKGSAKYELCSLIKELDLENNVLIHEPVPYEKMPSYISLCDTGILPLPESIEWKVSSPLKLMEYLVMEKPVIITDIEAHREVINGAACGIYIPSSSPEHIAEGITKAYKMKDKLKQIGQEGRKIVEQNYTWDRQAKALISFLESI